MAYFEAQQAAVSEMVPGYQNIPSLIRAILVDAPDETLKAIADAAECADSHNTAMQDKAYVDAGKLVIGAINQSLSAAHPIEWADGDEIPDESASCFSDADERFREDAHERFLDVSATAKRMAG